MIGAIAGDIIGSVFEFDATKSYDFPLFCADSTFTDDTVLSVATASCMLHGRAYADAYKNYALEYPDKGYGGMFRRWTKLTAPSPYNSFGNGSAMRVSPVGFASASAAEAIDEAKKSAEVTHNHPEGIKGAQAVALAVCLARAGKGKKFIKDMVTRRCGYDLGRPLDSIRPGYGFDETCQGTVPEAIIAFLESANYVDAVRKAVSLGGDADTMGCITGAIAQAFYKEIPGYIVQEVRRRVPAGLMKVVDEFNAKYGL